MKKTIEQVFQTGKGGSYEISGVGPKGSVSWYATQVGPIKQDGQIVSATLITTDITERKKMEKQLKEYSEHLEEKVEERTNQLKKAQEQLLKAEKIGCYRRSSSYGGTRPPQPAAGYNQHALYCQKRSLSPSPLRRRRF